MKKTWVVIAAIGVLALAGSLAYAQGPGFGWGPGYGRGPGWGPGWQTASLTAEQQAQVDKLRQEHWAEMGKLREKLFAKRGELLAARREATPDTAKIEALTKELNALYAEHAQQRDAHRAEVAKLTGTDLPGAGSGPGCGRGFGPGTGRMMGYGPGFGRGAPCPAWQ